MSTYFTTVANLVTIIYQIVFVVNEFVSSVTIVINTIHPFIQDRSGLGTLLGIDPDDDHFMLIPLKRSAGQRTRILLLFW